MVGACSAAEEDEEEEEDSTVSRNRCGDGGVDGAFVAEVCVHMLSPSTVDQQAPDHNSPRDYRIYHRSG